MRARKINCSTKCPLDGTPREYSEDSSTRQDRTMEDLKKTDTEILQTDRIPQEKGSLRRIQEPEHRTENITSLV
jgi:hypothetical protein